MPSSRPPLPEPDGDPVPDGDHVPEASRRQLTVRAYRLGPDGAPVRDTGAVTVDPDAVPAYGWHPAATWPTCTCPAHGGPSAHTD